MANRSLHSSHPLAKTPPIAPSESVLDAFVVQAQPRSTSTSLQPSCNKDEFSPDTWQQRMHPSQKVFVQAVVRPIRHSQSVTLSKTQLAKTNALWGRSQTQKWPLGAWSGAD